MIKRDQNASSFAHGIATDLIKRRFRSQFLYISRFYFSLISGIALLLPHSLSATEKPSYKKATSGLEYVLQSPQDDQKHKASALFVWLHGAGGSGALSAENFSYREPLGEDTLLLFPNASRGKSWQNTDVKKICSLVKEIQETHGIASTSTYVGGFSRGGFFCYAVAFEDPELFQGILSFGGALPVRFLNKQKELPQTKKHLKLPIHIYHGTLDKIIPIELADQTCEQLKKAGYQIHFVEDEEMAHSIAPGAIKKALNWIKTQNKASP